jgi:Methyltransferase domain
MICKVCGSDTKEILTSTILNKYSIKYYQCLECRFIQTEEPFWLDEAYSDAIADLDTGYANRNVEMSSLTECVIKFFYSSNKMFLDFGGGYGMFVRLMRDKGYDFYLQDYYCQNIFAKYFEFKETEGKKEFELVTSFEVFEHLNHPIDEITALFGHSDSILFSTELQPSKRIAAVEDWWYFVPETGQHISFYSLDALKFIAAKFNARLYSNGKNLHLITKKKHFINPVVFATWIYYLKKFFIKYIWNRKTLINHDIELIKSRLLKSVDEI